MSGLTGIMPIGEMILAWSPVSLCNLVFGDHLHPDPWQDEPIETVMKKARVLLRDSVSAGYGKIHLDLGMLRVSHLR